jgi:hypothetical protein
MFARLRRSPFAPRLLSHSTGGSSSSSGSFGAGRAAAASAPDVLAEPGERLMSSAAGAMDTSKRQKFKMRPRKGDPELKDVLRQFLKRVRPARAHRVVRCDTSHWLFEQLFVLPRRRSRGLRSSCTLRAFCVLVLYSDAVFVSAGARMRARHLARLE